jgi:hypothetical protein
MSALFKISHAYLFERNMQLTFCLPQYQKFEFLSFSFSVSREFNVFCSFPLKILEVYSNVTNETHHTIQSSISFHSSFTTFFDYFISHFLIFKIQIILREIEKLFSSFVYNSSLKKNTLILETKKDYLIFIKIQNLVYWKIFFFKGFFPVYHKRLSVIYGNKFISNFPQFVQYLVFSFLSSFSFFEYSSNICFGEGYLFDVNRPNFVLQFPNQKIFLENGAIWHSSIQISNEKYYSTSLFFLTSTNFHLNIISPHFKISFNTVSPDQTSLIINIITSFSIFSIS